MVFVGPFGVGLKRGGLLFALLGSQWAARVKGTAAWWVERVRDLARHLCACLPSSI